MARIDPSLWSAGGGATLSPAVPLTLAQVRDRLEDAAELSIQKRADLRSALNTVGRAFGLPLDAIPASPAILRQRLEQISPAALGVGKQSWANTRSRLLKALDLTGVPVMAGRSVGFMAPDWEELLERIEDRFRRQPLTRFLGFCSTRGISPQTVTAETFEQYRSSVELLSMRAGPRSAYRATCAAWNKARETVCGWPDLEVSVPENRNRYALPWSTFPASLKADIDAMVGDATGIDLVNMKAHRRIKPISARIRVENLHRLVSGYVLRGNDPQALRTLADVVRLEAVREGLRFHLDRSGGRPTAGIDDMVVAACTIARQWVEVSDAELQALKRLRRSLGRNVYEMAPETRAMLRAFDDERKLAALLNAPGRTLRRYAGRNRLSRSEAASAAAALAVQILLDAPVRVRNLASIDLNRHVLRIGSGRRARVHLHFPAEEVKNYRELELPLSPETIELLDLYLSSVRPQLVRTPNSFLFPGEAARHKRPSLLSRQIADFVHEHVGIRVTAHKFRHLVGYLYLKENPGSHEVVRQLLGHKSIATTIRFYASLEQEEAFRLYDSFLDGLRKQAAETPVRRRRRR